MSGIGFAVMAFCIVYLYVRAARADTLEGDGRIPSQRNYSDPGKARREARISKWRRKHGLDP